MTELVPWIPGDLEAGDEPAAPIRRCVSVTPRRSTELVERDCYDQELLRLEWELGLAEGRTLRAQQSTEVVSYYPATQVVSYRQRAALSSGLLLAMIFVLPMLSGLITIGVLIPDAAVVIAVACPLVAVLCAVVWISRNVDP